MRNTAHEAHAPWNSFSSYILIWWCYIRMYIGGFCVIFSLTSQEVRLRTRGGSESLPESNTKTSWERGNLIAFLVPGLAVICAVSHHDVITYDRRSSPFYLPASLH